MLSLALPGLRRKKHTPGGKRGTGELWEWRILSVLKTELRVRAERPLQLLVATETGLVFCSNHQPLLPPA